MKQNEQHNNEQKQQINNKNTEHNKMELMPESLANTLPKLYETENIQTENKLLLVRYIAIFSNWEWLVSEYDPIEGIAFGYVISGLGSDCNEWGYFSIEELEQMNGDNLQIIREEDFQPITFKELQKLLGDSKC